MPKSAIWDKACWGHKSIAPSNITLDIPPFNFLSFCLFIVLVKVISHNKQCSRSYNLSYSLFNNWFGVRSSRYEARGKFGEHERCVRVARGVALASRVLSKLPKCFISRWTHSWRMNQLFYNIFNPMENFFSRDLFADVMSVHNRNMKHARAIEFD